MCTGQPAPVKSFPAPLLWFGWLVVLGLGRLGFFPWGNPLLFHPNAGFRFSKGNSAVAHLGASLPLLLADSEVTDHHGTGAGPWQLAAPCVQLVRGAAVSAVFKLPARLSDPGCPCGEQSSCTKPASGLLCVSSRQPRARSCPAFALVCSGPSPTLTLI